jgi:hypothetical protein
MEEVFGGARMVGDGAGELDQRRAIALVVQLGIFVL